MEPRLIEFLEYWLGCNENKILSEETLWWLLKKKVVNYEWTEWYRKRFKLKQPNFFLRTFYKLVEVK